MGKSKKKRKMASLRAPLLPAAKKAKKAKGAATQKQQKNSIQFIERRLQLLRWDSIRNLSLTTRSLLMSNAQWPLSTISQYSQDLVWKARI